MTKIEEFVVAKKQIIKILTELGPSERAAELALDELLENKNRWALKLLVDLAEAAAPELPLNERK